jgi:hypothetical protein
MSHRRAWTAALAVVAASYGLVAGLTVPPRLGGVVTDRERRAAVAVRDFVPRFEQWGTREFTVPYLEKHYERTYYLTFPDRAGEMPKFANAVEEALSEADGVDLFLLSHSNEFAAGVARIDADRRTRLRMVYNCGCGNAEQGPTWLKLGAKAYIGHVGERSQSPVFYVYFLRDWVGGVAVGEAVANANADAGWVFDRVYPNPAAVRAATEAKLYGNANLTIGGDP